MRTLPLRLPPGADLKRDLAAQAQAAAGSDGGAFVLSGIGSLSACELRLAGADRPTAIDGPLEILTLAGSLTADGAHLHMSVSDAQGRVRGGHVADGNVVRTTVEVLLALLPGVRLAREFDARTGFDELVVRTGSAPAR